MNRLCLPVGVPRSVLTSQLKSNPNKASIYASPAQLCRFANSSAWKVKHEATDIAVLGGGITGLASAYYLTKSLPHAKITLFEASPRLGGWLHSKQVDVGDGSIVFEQGPRNLRPTAPNGLITLDLVHDLGMEDRVLMTNKDSVAAQNRFIYYPDHLVRMPGPGMSLFKNLSNIWSESIFDGFFSDIPAEVGVAKRPESLQDESIGSFISRRFGSTLADNVVSAVFHGIYAGDIYKLSARTILAGLWQLEAESPSVLAALICQSIGTVPAPIATSDLKIIKEFQDQPPKSGILAAVRKSSVFTFKGGIGELADRLEAKLLSNPNVDIRRETLAKEIMLTNEERGPRIQLNALGPSKDENPVRNFSHVISTIAGDKLALITSKSSTRDLWPTLGQTPAVTVMVVNLFYPNADVLPVRGFGYLLPRSIAFERNPERALGVVFDSDASIGQDNVSGTKVTVMLGGHWWDQFETYPDEDEGASMAKAVLRRHLGISEEPSVVRVSLQQDCIPQYAVGHDERMAGASRALEDWKGRLRVAGNSYTGVGLNDCIRAAKDVVQGLATNTGRTGLDAFVGGKKWSWVWPRELKIN